MCIRNAILDHSLQGVHGTLLVGISIALRYIYSLGLLIAVVLAIFTCKIALQHMIIVHDIYQGSLYSTIVDWNVIRLTSAMPRDHGIRIFINNSFH